MNKINNKISFLLVVAGYQNIELVENIQFKSFIKFMDINDIEDYIIICKDNEEEYIKTKYKNYIDILKLKIIKESLILNLYNKNIKYNNSNYKLQMFLKLASHKIINTEVYCTLDSDVYLTKNISFKDFFYNNKLRCNIEPMKTHQQWWESASNVLSYNINDNIYNGCGVTPFLLRTDIINNLNSYLLTINTNLYDIFFNNKHFITEYTLYWVYILKI